jgi:hypothetical protein
MQQLLALWRLVRQPLPRETLDPVADPSQSSASWTFKLEASGFRRTGDWLKRRTKTHKDTDNFLYHGRR